jgi:hypothetical protein
MNPPCAGVAVPVGEKTPLIRGSPEVKISSCASSGNVAANHDIALEMVATQDADGHPRATSASTSHWVTKSASKPPNRTGAVMRNTSASLSASKVSGGSRRARSAASACWRSIGTSAAARSTSSRRDGVVVVTTEP